MVRQGSSAESRPEGSDLPTVFSMRAKVSLTAGGIIYINKDGRHTAATLRGCCYRESAPVNHDQASELRIEFSLCSAVNHNISPSPCES